MAKTALIQLQDQIEAVRREAFAAGYAAAMQSVRDFAAKPAPGAEPAAARPARRGRPAGRRQARAAASAPRRAARATRRPQRGTNARLVEEVLQANAPRALRPAEIRRALQRDKGVAMAFTSIRHALAQLEERHTAEQIADSKTWRYEPAGAASA